jgi:hypothetical protein
MSLIELPFDFPGRIFRRPMLFGPYNLHGEVYDRALIMASATPAASLCEAQAPPRLWQGAFEESGVMLNGQKWPTR